MAENSGAYDEMGTEELQVVYDNLRDEMLENDGQLAARRYRPTGGNASVQPIADYQTWRANIVARQNEIRRDLAYVKALLNERRSEAWTVDKQRSQVRWRAVAKVCRAALHQIIDEPSASPEIIRIANAAIAQSLVVDQEPATV